MQIPMFRRAVFQRLFIVGESGACAPPLHYLPRGLPLSLGSELPPSVPKRFQRYCSGSICHTLAAESASFLHHSAILLRKASAFE